MGDIAQRGNRLTKGIPTHPDDLRPKQDIRSSRRLRVKRPPIHPDDLLPKQEPRLRRFGGGRTNLLEELGRVEAEPSNRNRRAEISRVHGELNRGYAKGGKVFTVTETKKGKPHWTQEGQDASIKRKFKRKSDAHQEGLKAKREDKAKGGRHRP